MVDNKNVINKTCGNCKFMDDFSTCGNIISDKWLKNVSLLNNCKNFQEKENSTSKRRLDAIGQLISNTEKVNHPSHYNKGIEAIDIIESWDLNFSLGNAIKYIVRSPYKGNKLEDLEKAEWYIKREIERIKQHNTTKE